MVNHKERGIMKKIIIVLILLSASVMFANDVESKKTKEATTETQTTTEKVESEKKFRQCGAESRCKHAKKCGGNKNECAKRKQKNQNK